MCARARRAAQEAGVAALEAEAGDVDGHVGARLVDDEQHAERHAHLLHVEAVRQPPARDDLADRIVERGDGAHRVAQRQHALGVEREPVEQRARLAGGARRGEILARWPRRSRRARARARARSARAPRPWRRGRASPACARRRGRGRSRIQSSLPSWSTRLSRWMASGTPATAECWPAARRSSALPMATTPVANASPSSVHTRTASPARNVPSTRLHADRQQARAAREQRRARAGVDEHAARRRLAVAQPELPGRDGPARGREARPDGLARPPRARSCRAARPRRSRRRRRRRPPSRPPRPSSAYRPIRGRSARRRRGRARRAARGRAPRARARRPGRADRACRGPRHRSAARAAGRAAAARPAPPARRCRRT